ncbi:MAG: formate dehydrogenase subunit delta [Burkholderiales bacterium]|nr:formate dehydrogenase subunit delta [Burkholderiales bacterium]
MDGAQLVRMINDISNFFNSEKDQEIAAAGVVGHITKFWNPRMRKQLVEHVEKSGAGDLSDLGQLAVHKLGQIN